jgi:mono/diheme cytochrome c family protein
MEKTLRTVSLASLALIACLGLLYIGAGKHPSRYVTPAEILHPTRAARLGTPRVNATEKPARETDRQPGVLFDKNCATCHGQDGRAKTFKAKFNHARDLTDAKWQGEVSDERIFNSISNGKGKMPAWGKKFSEGEINALVAFVRKLKK